VRTTGNSAASAFGKAAKILESQLINVTVFFPVLGFLQVGHLYHAPIIQKHLSRPTH